MKFHNIFESPKSLDDYKKSYMIINHTKFSEIDDIYSIFHGGENEFLEKFEKNIIIMNPIFHENNSTFSGEWILKSKSGYYYTIAGIDEIQIKSFDVTVSQLWKLHTRDELGITDTLTTQEFLDFHENSNNYRKHTQTFQQIYSIFNENGFDNSKEVNECYEGIQEEDRIRISKLIEEIQ